jgi:CHAD domain-containing protein
MDVLVLALRERQGDVPAGDLDALMSFLGQVRQREHRGLVEALDSDRYRRLLVEWEAFLRRPVLCESEANSAGRPLVDVVARRAWRLTRRIARNAKVIDGSTTAAHLHEVRICAKKLRYLIDVTPAFYDAADLERILSALKKLQRVLGDFNDAHSQEQRLLECGLALGAAGGPAGALLGLGRLAEQSRQRGERLRAEAIGELARFRARETKSACRRAFRRAGATEGAR